MKRMKHYDVAALGELLIDFAPHSTNPAGYPVLSANPGGAPGNFLAALTNQSRRRAGQLPGRADEVRLPDGHGRQGGG